MNPKTLTVAELLELDVNRLLDEHRCVYCAGPVSEEYDPEVGKNFFPSWHYACICTKADGRFVVLSTRGFSVDRYEHARKAVDAATALENANTPYNGTRFAVLDLETNVLVYESARDPQGELFEARRAVTRLEKAVAR